MKKTLILSLLIVIALIGIQCSIYQTMVNLSRLQFKLGDVNSFSLMNIPISNKTSISDFSALDVINITSSVSEGKFPVSFILNVNAKNPNDGTGGYTRTDATLKDFAWTLELDGKKTISGRLDNSVSVPGTGDITVIPLRMDIDLKEFFAERGYESLINLALALGGTQGSSSKVALYAKPTVSTVLGDISYPGELKIVDTQFSN
ncbi:MAG TPA: hypothetical protein VK870_15530 [Ignavibacteriaceae bacterium]|nr:hypothetical protein [Ignavibacteriaceae bacterium]